LFSGGVVVVYVVPILLYGIDSFFSQLKIKLATLVGFDLYLGCIKRWVNYSLKITCQLLQLFPFSSF